jgi:ankyrin repeat protein
MPKFWTRISDFIRNIRISSVCVVILLSALFTALPYGFFSDLSHIEWYWGCPRSVYAFEQYKDGDFHVFSWNRLIFDLLFWIPYFSLLGVVVRMTFGKIGIKVRPFYSLCITGALTGIIYAVLFRPDALINFETGGYLSCFESRREQFDQAMRFGDVEAAKILITKHPDLVFSKDVVDSTPLHEAAYYGQKEIVKLLLANKADLRFKDMYGETPLFDSAMNGFLGATEVLLKNGAEVNIKDQSGETPLFRAAEGANSSVIKILLANHADVNAVCREEWDGWTPLHEAAWQGHKSVVQMMIANGAEINTTDYQGETPLYLASWNGHKDVVELLLANKADVNAKDSHGTTPLQLAMRNGYTNVAELLRQYAATNNY